MNEYIVPLRLTYYKCYDDIAKLIIRECLLKSILLKEKHAKSKIKRIKKDNIVFLRIKSTLEFDEMFNILIESIYIEREVFFKNILLKVI